MKQQSVDYSTKFIQLTIRTIYRYRIDVGVLRWLFLTGNFLYFTSLLYPIIKFNVPALNESSDLSEFSNANPNDLNRQIQKQIVWREGYKVLFLIFRPTQILNFYEDNSLNLLLAIIIFVIHLLLLLGILYQVIFTPCNTYKQFKFMRWVLLFSNIYNYYFMMIAVEILFTIGCAGGFGASASSSFAESTTSQLAARIICLISIPLAYLFSLFSLIIGEQCITHEEYGLFRNNANTPLMFCISSLKFIIPIVIGVDPNYKQDHTYLLIWFLTMIFASLKYYEYYYDIPFSNFKVQNGYYILLNQTFIMVVLSFFRDDSNYNYSNKYTISVLKPQIFATILLVVTTVFQVFSFQLWFKMRAFVLFKNTASESELIKDDHKYVMRRINMLIMNQHASLTEQALQQIGVFLNHQSFCIDKHCFCHSQQMLKGEQNSQLLLNNRAYEQLIRMYIRNDLRLIDVFNNMADSFQFLRYMDHFLFAKKHTFALYKIIDIQIESEKMKKVINKKTQISLEVMLEILKETMSNDIKKGIVDMTVEQTSKAIEVYIQMENLKSILKVMIYKCLEMKQQTLEQMKKSFEVSQQVEDLNSNYNTQLDTTEAMLVEFYNRFTTPLNQLILVFFECEIKGNLKKAHYIKQQHKQSDIAEYLTSKNMFIEVFSQDVISITATVGKKLGRIVGYSDKAPNVFGYKKQEFDYITDIKDLMPITLAKVHDEVVRFMMIRGRYNVVHIARQVFLRNKNNFIFLVNIFADINFFYAEELPFIFMAKVIRTNSAYFIVNKKGRVEGMCQNFFLKINQNVESLPFMFKFNVQYLIPKFETLILDIKPFIKQDFVDIDMTFPEVKSQLFNDLFYKNKQQKQNFTSAAPDKDQSEGLTQLDSLRTQQSQVRNRMAQRDSEILKFKVDISIQKRVLGTTQGDLVYYVVEIKSVTLTAKGLNWNGSMNGSSYSVMHKSNNMSKQKSCFSKSETIQQAMTMSSLEQLEEEQQVHTQNNRSSYLPEQILESDRESKVSSSTAGKFKMTHRSNQQKKKINQKSKTKEKSVKVDQKIQNLNDSEMLLFSNKESLNTSVLNGVQLMETNRSMAESEIMVEHRFVSLQETQKGQLIQKQQGNKAQASSTFCKQPDTNQKELQQQENEIQVDINDLNMNNTNVDNTMVNEPESTVEKSRENIDDQQQSQSRTSKRNVDKKSEKKSMNTSKRTDTAFERYKKAQQKLMKQSSGQDLSLSQAGNDNEDDLKQQMKLGSSVNGEESDKIKQIDKFSYFEAFTEQKTQPQSLKLLKILKIFEYATMIITSIVIATSINSSLKSFIASADSILFRGNLIMPYSTFSSIEFLSRRIKKIPTYPDLANVMAYLDSQLDKQYDLLKTNLTETYQQNNLVSEYSSDYINLENAYLIQIQGSTSGDPNESLNRIDQIQSNFTLIDCMGQILFHLSNIKGIGISDDPQINKNEIQSILFAQHNFKNFISRSRENIDKQFVSTIDMKDNLNTSIIIISSLMICFTFIVFTVIILNYKNFQARMVQILNIITTVKTSSVESDIIRVKSMLESLKENDEMIEKYTFSIRQKEYELTRLMDDEHLYSQDSRKKKILFVKINQQKLSNMRFYLVSSFSAILFFIYILVNLLINIQFLDTYRAALQYLDDFGRISFELPSLLTYSCIIHDYKLDNSQKFLATEIDAIKENYSSSILFIQDFSLGAYEIKRNTFFTPSFLDYFNSKMKDDLCQYYPDMSTTECQHLFSGSLSQGLVNSLSTWKELFKQTQNIDFQLTNTATFYSGQIETLKFSLVLNQAMGILTESIYNEMKSVIQQQYNIVLLFAILFSIIITIPKLYELTKEFQTISMRFFQAKKIVFMLPLYTLMIEETFNKMLKAIGNKLNIQK